MPPTIKILKARVFWQDVKIISAVRCHEEAEWGLHYEVQTVSGGRILLEWNQWIR